MSRVLAMDRGNNSLKGSLIEDGRIVTHWRAEGTAEDIRAWVSDSDPEGVVISSVVREWNGLCRDTLKSAGVERIVFAAYDSPWPFELGILKPETAGPDRLCAVAAVMERGVTDAVIVDAGSAVTVDSLMGGVFKGGAIMPGLEMMLRSLSERTSALPLIPVDEDFPDDFDPPGYDTESAIWSGVATVYQAGIKSLVSHSYSCFHDADPEIFLTGGVISMLRHLFHPSPVIVPDLVLEGLNCLYNRQFG